jgi:hypothetical protein
MSNENFRDRSSDLRELIFDPILSGEESGDSEPEEPDVGLGQNENVTYNDDSEDEHSLTDFSSGSSDYYEPDEEELSEWNREHDTDFDAQVRPEEPVPNLPLLLPENVPANPRANELPNIPRPLPITNDPRWVIVYPPELEKIPEFLVREGTTGIQNCPPRNSPPLAYFFLFFTQTIWRMLVRETNKYAGISIENANNTGTMRRNSRMKAWVDVTVREMKKFIAVMLNMGLIYKQNLESYWDMSRTQKTPFFSETMGLKRYQLISSMLHCNCEPAIPRDQPGYDPWHKIRPFVDEINAKFKQFFVPKQPICIDESMVGMKNRCIFIQYMPNKRHNRFGIKKFEVCDSETSYVLHSELYSGKDFLSDGDEPLAQKVVLDLLTKCNLLGKGYHLFTDNWYTKIPLAEALLKEKTYLTGTVRKRSKGLSKSLLNRNLGVGETVYFRKKNVLLVGYKEKKKRKPVYCLTTACHAEDVQVRSKGGREAIKPVLIANYNAYMGGVDVKDKTMYHFSCDRPTRRYWKKIFVNFIDMALHNAFILYKANTDKEQQKNHRDFLISIIEELTTDQVQVENAPGPGGDVLGPRHALSKLPNENNRLCIVCLEKNLKKKTTYWCPGCNGGIHQNCYHLLDHYFRPIKKGRKRARQSSESE